MVASELLSSRSKMADGRLSVMIEGRVKSSGWYFKSYIEKYNRGWRSWDRNRLRGAFIDSQSICTTHRVNRLNTSLIEVLNRIKKLGAMNLNIWLLVATIAFLAILAVVESEQASGSSSSVKRVVSSRKNGTKTSSHKKIIKKSSKTTKKKVIKKSSTSQKKVSKYSSKYEEMMFVELALAKYIQKCIFPNFISKNDQLIDEDVSPHD